MKILIIGAEGQVGGFLMNALSPRHEVSGTSMLGVPGLPVLDIRDNDAVHRLVESQHPDHVILTAALTHVDKCEEMPEEAAAINTAGPCHVAQACRAAGAGMSFFSTDYVFDGKQGPYGEADEPSPESVYARTKLEAEEFIRATLSNHLIVRTMMVFSYLPGSVNFYMQVWDRARKGQPITAPGDQLGNPTHAVSLARALTELIENGHTGLFHLAGATLVDKAEFARRIVARLGYDPGLVTSVTTAELKQKAKRPLLSGLKIDKARAVLKKNPLWDLDTALNFSVTQMQESTTRA